MSYRLVQQRYQFSFAKSVFRLFLLSLVVMLSGCATMIKKTLPPPAKPPFQYQGVNYDVFIDSNQVSGYNTSYSQKRYFVSITKPNAAEGKNLVPQKIAKAVAFDYMRKRVCNRVFSQLKPIFDHKFNPSSVYRGGYFKCAKR